MNDDATQVQYQHRNAEKLPTGDDEPVTNVFILDVKGNCGKKEGIQERSRSR